MNPANWLRPPRHLFVLFAAVTLVPAVVLIGLGWQLVKQDRILERQRAYERLEATADRITSALVRDLDAMSRDLPRLLTDPAARLGPGAILVRFQHQGIVARAGAPLLFEPVVQFASAEAPASLWQSAETLEFRRNDRAAAANAYRVLATSDDPDTRARALVNQARNLRAENKNDEALTVYRTLAELTTARVIEEPADLVARAAECALLAKLGRSGELKQAAESLSADLARGRWSIDRATFESRSTELRQWVQPGHHDDAVALAGTIESAWSAYVASDLAVPGGHRSVWANERGVLLLWQSNSSEALVLAADASFLSRLSALSRTDEPAIVTLMDADGHIVVGDTRSRTDRRAAEVVRARDDTGLPWTLRITAADSAGNDAAVAGRRRLLTWSLAVLAFLIPAGGYVVARAVQKQLAVARLQTDFVSAVSHEFRTPLTSLAHLTERLQRDGSITHDRRRQYYDTIARDTGRLRRFVETLLDFGRMETGSLTLDLQPADLASVVTDIVEEFKAEPAATLHPISFSATGTVPPVRLDRDAFGRALWNLLDNAAKYSPADSPIVVEIAREADQAVVRVRDRGRGVPPAEQQQIFGKFVRGSDLAGSGIKGTGIGLALVERIVRAHGGDIRLESTAGEGSTFSVHLPVEDEPTHD